MNRLLQYFGSGCFSVCNLRIAAGVPGQKGDLPAEFVRHQPIERVDAARSVGAEIDSCRNSGNRLQASISAAPASVAAGLHCHQGIQLVLALLSVRILITVRRYLTLAASG
jgi:hypothetical protein